MMSLFHPRRNIPRLSRGVAMVLGFVIFGLAWNLLSVDYEREGKAFLLPSPQRVASSFADYFGYGSKTEEKIKVARETLAPGSDLDQTIQEIRSAAREEIKVLGGDLRVSTVFQLMLMVADEIRRVPYELLQVSYTLGGSRIEAVSKVLLPASLPGIFDAMRLCNGWAWAPSPTAIRGNSRVESSSGWPPYQHPDGLVCQWRGDRHVGEPPTGCAAGAGFRFLTGWFVTRNAVGGLPNGH